MSAVAFDVPCPLNCGVVLHPRIAEHDVLSTPHERRRNGWNATMRTIIRRAVRQHLELHHADLSTRQRSLLCDKACGDNVDVVLPVVVVVRA